MWGAERGTEFYVRIKFSSESIQVYLLHFLIPSSYKHLLNTCYPGVYIPVRGDKEINGPPWGAQWPLCYGEE